MGVSGSVAADLKRLIIEQVTTGAKSFEQFVEAMGVQEDVARMAFEHPLWDVSVSFRILDAWELSVEVRLAESSDSTPVQNDPVRGSR